MPLCPLFSHQLASLDMSGNDPRAVFIPCRDEIMQLVQYVKCHVQNKSGSCHLSYLSARVTRVNGGAKPQWQRPSCSSIWVKEQECLSYLII